MSAWLSAATTERRVNLSSTDTAGPRTSRSLASCGSLGVGSFNDDTAPPRVWPDRASRGPDHGVSITGLIEPMASKQRRDTSGPALIANVNVLWLRGCAGR